MDFVLDKVFAHFLMGGRDLIQPELDLIDLRLVHPAHLSHLPIELLEDVLL